MENGHLHDDKLFRAVHDRLSDYEAPFNGADWDAMSRSLDALPKATRFQFKISLNSILVAIGVLGISALGYALASHSGSSAEKSRPVATVKQNAVPVKQNITVNNSQNNSQPAATQQMQTSVPVDNSTSTMMNVDYPENTNNTALLNSDLSGQKTKKHDKNKLRFGDEIDPRKGFIYHTQEPSNLAEQTIVDPNPNLFYDAENGSVKKIIIKKDSTGTKSSAPHKPVSDSTKPSAPTGEERQGFDIGG
ncbi:MAG TPA: hypothetical protein VFJ43_08810 [Bacteroidia bacterium]|nr:hypothetical protein [Bacteroidia bacterium]